jgi:hypothetical protein
MKDLIARDEQSSRVRFIRHRLLIAGCLVFVALAGCELGVTNPGRISDSALDSEEAIGPMVNGMAGDFATIFDEVAYFMGIASWDITHCGAFEEEEFMQRGEIIPRHVNGLWGELHRARWVAEAGVARIEAVLGGAAADEPLVTEAYIWAGFANRVLGENMCVSVFDGGPAGDHTDHFTRAEGHFTQAISLAQGQGEAELLQTAYAGRAQVRLALEDWTGARDDARQVSDDHLFEAVFGLGDDREYNWLYNQSHTRDYFSAYNTLAWTLDNSDPRMPITDMERVGVDGLTPMFRQDKILSHGDNIALAQGDEMRLIEAEVALRADNDIAAAMQLINDVRTAAGVATKTATTMAEAMAVLREERDIIFWMEGRRLWELRRFDDPFLSGRDSCIPVSEYEEQTNPNF